MYHYSSLSALLVALCVALALAQTTPLDPGLPVPNPTTPGWFSGYFDAYNPQYQTYRSTIHLPSTADVTIIGGGWTGVTTAYFLSLLAPHLKVVLLEARGIAQGASGRNLGWMAPKTYDSFISQVASIGLTAVKEEVEFENKVAQDLYDLAALNGWSDYIEIVKDGHVRIYRAESDWNTTLTNLAAYRAAGYNDVITYSAAECNALFGLTNIVGCTKSLKAYKLRPPAYVWKLLESALENNNLNVQTQTAVTSITALSHAPSQEDLLPYLSQLIRPAQYEVTTARGSIQTNTIVYATDCWTPHLLPNLQYGGGHAYNIYPSLQYVIQSNLHSPQSTLDIEFAPNQYGLQQRESGGWIVAQGFIPYISDDSTVNQAVFNDSINFLNTVYPRDVPPLHIAHQWSGVQGYSSDGEPFVGPVNGHTVLGGLRSHQWISAGLTGHGNPRAFGLARALVNEMLFGIIEPNFPPQYQTNLRPNFNQ